MPPRRLALLLGLLLAVVAVPPTAAAQGPLPGSAFDGSDGDQLDAGTVIDWQGLQAAGRVSYGPDDNAADSTFDGGNKELEPGQWVFSTSPGGVTPAKNNILASWYSVDRQETDSYLYFAFHRAATTGATFLGYEVNQLATSFVNSVGETVPCRIDGDALLSFEVDPSDSAGVQVVLYRWTPTATDAATGCSTVGTFTADPPLVATLSQGAMNFAGDVANFLPGAPASLTAGSFGEGAVNFTRIIGDSCVRYQQIQLHSRTSASISAALTDFVSPIPLFIGGCAIQVDKTGPATAAHGETVTFRYAVTNPGAKPLSGVTLSDDRCSAISGPTGDTDADGVLDLFETWEYACTTTLGAHAEGEADPVVNTATVSGSYLGQVVSAQDTHSTDVVHPVAAPAAVAADLVIDKSVVGGTGRVGDPLTYRVTVANRGPGTATSVVVTDTLSDLVRFVSATASQGSCAGAPQLRCAIGTLAAGANASVTISVVPLRAGTLANTAIVSAAEPDPQAPNVARVETPIRPRPNRARIAKSATRRSARPGDVVTYVIRYRNLGPRTSRRVQVCDRLPRRVTLVSAPRGRLSRGRVCWRYARVAAGTTVRMRLRVRVDADAPAGTLRNVVTATSPDARTVQAVHRLPIRPRPRPTRAGGVTG